jgi:hypothetical protein
VIRYFYLGSSGLLLLMSVTHPRTQSSIVDVESLAFLVGLYDSVFLFCVVIFIPMVVVAFYYFVSALNIFWRQRSLRVGTPILLLFIVISTALYSFNYWVISELF